MSVFTVDYELPERDRFDTWGTTNRGQGDKRRLYRVNGVRFTTGPKGSVWRWLGYPCRADGQGLSGARQVAVPACHSPNRPTRIRVLRELRADLNRFDLELAEP